MHKKKVAFGVDEVASLLGLHKNSVYRAIWKGEIRAVKLGARLLVPRSELERLLGGPVDDDPRPEAGEK